VNRGLVALLGLAAALCGCGDSATSSKGPAPAARPPAKTTARSSDAQVIRRWADTLRAGDVEAAARLFAVPATVENGPPALRLTSPGDVVAFNESLPCGARLLRTRRRGRYTVATFRLTERVGGDCGTGVGDTAATAFRLRGGRIVEWRRVPTPARPAGPPPDTSTS
jgi:limonene-1,2-epoxide hydrolase